MKINRRVYVHRNEPTDLIVDTDKCAGWEEIIPCHLIDEKSFRRIMAVVKATGERGRGVDWTIDRALQRLEEK